MIMMLTERSGPPANAWAVYVRGPAGAPMLHTIMRLCALVRARGGHVAGIYGDTTDIAEELGVLLGHGSLRRFRHLAVEDVADLGVTSAAAAHAAVCLFDLGITLCAGRHLGELYPGDKLLDGDDVAAALNTAPGYLLGALSPRIGLEPPPR